MVFDYSIYRAAFDRSQWFKSLARKSKDNAKKLDWRSGANIFLN